jgi:tetratricopeptide (TPR) repeat protein
MKKQFLFLVSFLLTTTLLVAQPPKKPKPKEKAPTQTEMEKMMKEAQMEMDNLDPETLRMMDSMGIKKPSFKNVPKVSDKQLADAWEAENLLVPKKDAARIAAIPKTVTDARMSAYITSIQNKAVAFLKPEVKNMADEVYSYIKLNSKNSAEAGNMAIGLWVAGQPEMAYYMLGKICADDPANTDNLSNYASMLSTLGAQHLAIPVLNNLNAKFPKNSSLLNNLGQAWFGLGEIVKAEKYLDSAIRIYAYHPQANLTKAAIEESKGNSAKAIEALLKSIKHSFTKEKEDKLSKLGYKLTRADVRLRFKPSADPLGLGRFRQPDYPKTVSELKALLPQWEAFDNDCDKEIAKLKNELAEAGAKNEQNLKKTMAQTMQAINTGGIIPASAQVPLYATKASLAMQEVVTLNEVKMKKLGEMFLALGTKLDQLQKTRKRPAPEAPCEVHIKAQDDYLNNYNALKQSYNNEALKLFKFLYNHMAYWSQYTSTDEVQFEIIKLGFMIDWLKKLKEYRPLLTAGGYEKVESECVEKKDAKPGKLAEFDDIACGYKSKIDYAIIKIETNCSHSTTTYNLGKIKFIEKELGQNYIGGTLILKPKISTDVGVGPLGVEIFAGAEINIELDQENDVKDWNGTISSGIETGVGISAGPVKAGVSVTEAIEIEISSKGVGDVNVVTKVEASAGVKIGPVGKSVEIGVESRASLVTGNVTESGTGVLKNIKMPER